MRARFVVRGLVQGVNFRSAAVAEATRLGLTGRVRNREDGALEAVAEGAGEALEDFARWLRRGPRLAEVESVERTELEGGGRYHDFAIAYGPIAEAP